jgi:murein DD-endopeptidase MepM/ murein hydrolase activator NlpD
MRSFRPRPLLLPALLCALALCAAPAAGALGDGDGEDGGATGAADGAGARVVRLYEKAALATQRYEAGRREAEAQRARALRAEERLAERRRETAVLHDDLGRLARAQYRSGGGMPLTAQLVLADDPEELLRSQHVLARSRQTVGTALGRSRRAERRLAAEGARAAAAWQALERRSTGLAALRRDIEERLVRARARLQGEADASVAAGSCPGAVRPEQPPPSSSTGAWTAPVESYELSAAFGSGGVRWLNRHTGQDFAVPVGTPVRAAGAGRVVRVSCGGAFGIEVVVQHPGGYYTQYAHLAAASVDQGERVVAGQWVGQSGTTGNSTGPHLHFEVRVTPEAGSAVDPVPWLAERGVPVE